MLSIQVDTISLRTMVGLGKSLSKHRSYLYSVFAHASLRIPLPIFFALALMSTLILRSMRIETMTLTVLLLLLTVTVGDGELIDSV